MSVNRANSRPKWRRALVGPRRRHRRKWSQNRAELPARSMHCQIKNVAKVRTTEMLADCLAKIQPTPHGTTDSVPSCASTKSGIAQEQRRGAEIQPMSTTLALTCEVEVCASKTTHTSNLQLALPKNCPFPSSPRLCTLNTLLLHCNSMSDVIAFTWTPCVPPERKCHFIHWMVKRGGIDVLVKDKDAPTKD